MSSSEQRTRLVLEVIYFIVAYGVLFWYTSDDPFCFQPGSAPHLLVAARLALACTLWDFIVGLGVALTVEVVGEFERVIPFAAAITVGTGLASIPFWIYSGYGHFRFENTWNVSCVFTEGFGTVFCITVAPVLALATLLREWLILKRRKPALA